MMLLAISEQLSMKTYDHQNNPLSRVLQENLVMAQHNNLVIAQWPECMAPDGAEPCPQYAALVTEIGAIREIASKYMFGYEQHLSHLPDFDHSKWRQDIDRVLGQ